MWVHHLLLASGHVLGWLTGHLSILIVHLVLEYFSSLQIRTVSPWESVRWPQASKPILGWRWDVRNLSSGHSLLRLLLDFLLLGLFLLLFSDVNNDVQVFDLLLV